MFSPEQIRRIGNKNTDQYLGAADYLGLPNKILSRQRNLAVIHARGRRLSVKAAILGCNNLLAARISSNKYLTSRRLQQGGFRVPPHRLLSRDEYPTRSRMMHAAEVFADDRYPVVIKPVSGLGGRHVYAGIADRQRLREVVETLWKTPNEEFLVERHIYGRHYRVKSFDGEIVDLVARVPACVTGDGRRTIAALVEEKNARKRKAGFPTIVINESTNQILVGHGLTMESVLAMGQEQHLRHESNLYLGGDIVRLGVQTLHPSLCDYLARVATYTRLRWLGLDLIVDDIGAEDAHARVVINETSSAQAPNDYYGGESLETYLGPALMVLERFFELPLTAKAFRGDW